MNIKVRKWRVLGGFLLVLLVLGGVAIVHAGDNENPMEEGRLAEHALEVAGETLQQLKMEVKHDFGAGNAYGGVLRIIGAYPLFRMTHNTREACWNLARCSSSPMITC